MEPPITPPPELVREWRTQCSYHGNTDAITQAVACMAARWGFRQCIKVDAAWLEDKLQKARDQELEACCEWLRINIGTSFSSSIERELRAARRPKPPSLAEEGQRILVENGTTLDGRVELDPEDVSAIRAALVRLQELEKGNE